MIDLETLDTKPNCTVLTLGAVKFDPNSLEEPHSELYLKFDIDQQSDLGRSVSDDTIEWWAKQSPEAQAAAFDPDGRVTVEDGLDQLTKWIWGSNTIWGQGYGFDMTILEDMYRMVGKPIPWQFWQILDSRTLFKVLGIDPRKGIQTNEHNALADAYYQAKAVQIAYQTMEQK